MTKNGHLNATHYPLGLVYDGCPHRSVVHLIPCQSLDKKNTKCPGSIAMPPAESVPSEESRNSKSTEPRNESLGSIKSPVSVSFHYYSEIPGVSYF